MIDSLAAALGVLIAIALVFMPPFWLGYRLGYRRAAKAFTTASPDAQAAAGRDVIAKDLNKDFLISYRDSAGNESERRFTLHEILGASGKAKYIGGYCHLRKAPRTFRIDSVAKIIDAETGLISENARDVIATLMRKKKTIHS
jgi:predicted DNA-binding transcriptional regulator YafY